MARHTMPEHVQALHGPGCLLSAGSQLLMHEFCEAAGHSICSSSLTMLSMGKPHVAAYSSCQAQGRLIGDAAKCSTMEQGIFPDALDLV